jgi:hypothetical protein
MVLSYSLVNSLFNIFAAGLAYDLGIKYLVGGYFMKLLINYADKNFTVAQKLNTETGIKVAGFDKVISYKPQDMDAVFYSRNRKILRQSRLGGYALWKPYIIIKSLDQLSDGDYLFYCDAGSYFIKPIDPLIKICEEGNQDIIVFDWQGVEKHHTKRDAFILMDCDSPEYTDTKHRIDSFILFRKSPVSCNFAREWLQYAQDERLSTDLKNQLGYPNYEGFIEHRHDQSICSLLSKKYKLKAYRDPSQFGNDVMDIYPESRYGQLINQTRARNTIDWRAERRRVNDYMRGRKTIHWRTELRRVVKKLKLLAMML